MAMTAEQAIALARQEKERRGRTTRPSLRLGPIPIKGSRIPKCPKCKSLCVAKVPRKQTNRLRTNRAKRTQVRCEDCGYTWSTPLWVEQHNPTRAGVRG